MDSNILNNKYRIIDTSYSKNGTFGVVFKAINIQTNEVVAVKKIKHTIRKEGIDHTVIRENAILNVLNHKNIVTLTESFIKDNQAYLVFPFFQMNLSEFIIKQYKQKVPQSVVKKIMSQLLSALKTAHNARFMHRDVKLSNILIEKSKENAEDFTLKLADWGASRKFNTCKDQNFTDYVTPRTIRSPELLFQSKNYSQAVDIWSAGCLFYKLMFGQQLFQHVSVNQILFDINNKIGISEIDDEKWMVEMYNKSTFDYPEDDLKEYRKKSLDSILIKRLGSITPACDLLKKMLKINPQRRISASDALLHPYFDLSN